MNITDMITSLSEETIITAAIFVGAGLIYILRKFSFLNQQISDFKKADMMGRESLERELRNLSKLEDEIGSEIMSVQRQVGKELVDHEISVLNMSPKFQELGRQITDTLDEQSDSMIDVNRNMASMSRSISSLSKSTASNNQFEQINQMIPKLVSKLDQVNTSVKEESRKVTALLYEVKSIKDTLGVE